MSIDVIDLRDFYSQRLGIVARQLINRGIRERWPNAQGQRVLGVGYPTPYLGLFREEAERCLAFMPAAQGVIKWPSLRPGLAALTGTLYAIWRRRKILRQYHDQMNDKRRDLTKAVETQMRHAIDAFYHEVGLTFSPLESFCESEAKRHAPLREQIDNLDQAIGAIKAQLG